MSTNACFDIKSAQDFLEQIVLPEHNEYRKNIASQRHALLTTIVAYHMYEWANGCKFTADHFRQTYSKHLPLIDNFESARKIANGTKHFISSVQTRSEENSFVEIVQGFAPRTWQEGCWAHPLYVECAGKERPVDLILFEIVEFWKEQYPSQK